MRNHQNVELLSLQYEVLWCINRKCAAILFFFCIFYYLVVVCIVAARTAHASHPYSYIWHVHNHSRWVLLEGEPAHRVCMCVCEWVYIEWYTANCHSGGYRHFSFNWMHSHSHTAPYTRATYCVRSPKSPNTPNEFSLARLPTLAAAGSMFCHDLIGYSNAVFIPLIAIYSD